LETGDVKLQTGKKSALMALQVVQNQRFKTLRLPAVF